MGRLGSSSQPLLLVTSLNFSFLICKNGQDNNSYSLGCARRNCDVIFATVRTPYHPTNLPKQVKVKICLPGTSQKSSLDVLDCQKARLERMEWILEADVPAFPLLLGQVGPDTVSLLCRPLLWHMQRVMKRDKPGYESQLCFVT